MRVEKNFDEFIMRMKDPEKANKLIARYMFLDLMRIFGQKKAHVVGVEPDGNTIYVTYKVDS